MGGLNAYVPHRASYPGYLTMMPQMLPEHIPGTGEDSSHTLKVVDLAETLPQRSESDWVDGHDKINLGASVDQVVDSYLGNTKKIVLSWQYEKDCLDCVLRKAGSSARRGDEH
jgi:hypothetical protein